MQNLSLTSRCWKTPLAHAAGFLLAVLAGAVPAIGQEVKTPAEFKHLKYRLVGPAAGGRVCRVAGVPGDPRIYYAATAAGGIFKSVDGGNSWKAVTDDQPISSVGSIAIAASNPNIIYAGA